MDLSPLLASSFILSKLSTNILVSGTTSLGLEHKGIQMHVINDNHYLLPDVETDTDHLTEYPAFSEANLKNIVFYFYSIFLDFIVFSSGQI